MIRGEPRGFPRAAWWLAWVGLAVIGLALVVQWRGLLRIDWLTLWSAGRLALTGHAAAAYDPAALGRVAGLGDVGQSLPFAYPPQALLLLAPFAVVPPWLGGAAWVAIGLAAYLVAARSGSRASDAQHAAFAPLLHNAVIGQTGALTGALLLGGIGQVERRPWLAGGLLGLLLVKPQVALMVPVALVAARRWRVICAAAVSALVMTGAAWLAFGSAPFAALAGEAGTYAARAAAPAAARKFTSVYASAASLGIAPGAALALHGLVAALAAWRLWRGWRAAGPVDQGRVMLLLAASALASPYLFAYDMMPLGVVILWLAGQGEDRRLLLLCWAWPLLGLAQWFGLAGGPNLGVALPLLLLLLVERRLTDRSPQTAAGIAPDGRILAQSEAG